MGTMGTVTARDGTALRTSVWSPGGVAVRGMLIVHGLGEHLGRWSHVAGFFAERGYEVAAFDLRGHGESGGLRGHVDRFGDYVDDVEDVVNSGLVRTDLPWVMYGHSLGGLISVTYLGEERPHPAAAILSAPALDANVPGVLRLAAQVLGRIAPTLRIGNSISGAQLSRDAAVGEEYFEDPLVNTKASTRLGLEMFTAQGASRGVAESIDTPTLVLHGGDDVLVPPSASEPLARVNAVERRVYPGLRHEMHNEPEQDQVLSDVAAWLDATLP